VNTPAPPQSDAGRSRGGRRVASRDRLVWRQDISAARSAAAARLHARTQRVFKDISRSMPKYSTVGFNVPLDTLYGSFQGQFYRFTGHVTQTASMRKARSR